MAFFIIGIIALYIALIFRKYKTAYSVILTSTLLFLFTTSLLMWGLLAPARGMHMPFEIEMTRGEIYILIGAWYLVDIVCSIKIVRNHIDYKKTNRDR